MTMFSFFKFIPKNSSVFKKEKNMFAIKQFNDGFGIVDRHGILAEGTTLYGRARDAKRGATRRGLALAA